MNKLRWDSPPEMQIDTSKAYMAEIETNKGIIELATPFRTCTQNGQQLRILGQRGILRRRIVPPGDQQFHDSGGRSDRNRWRWSWL